MRTNIEINDELMAEAMAASGLATKRAVVEEGLRLLIRLRGQVDGLIELDGLGWGGDLDAIREGHPPRSA
jgi:Arc/MetJ family transcription regulator